MNEKYVFEVNFPFQQRELNMPPPVITATYKGKVIFDKEPYSNPLTEMPTSVDGLLAESNKISLHVKVKKGPEKTFSIDLKKGVYLFIYFDLKKKILSLKQQVEPPGYD